MSNPPISSGTQFIRHSVGVPTATAAQVGATWRGIGMVPCRPYPLLPELAFSLQGSGRVSLTETVPSTDPRFPRGSRMGRTAGTVDLWLTTADQATDVILLQSTEDATAAPFHTFGLNGSNQFVGSLEDKDGVTVAAWAATGFAAVPEGRTFHAQVAWNSLTGYVKVTVNGKEMDGGDFTTPPAVSWSGFVPNYMSAGVMADVDFNATLLLTQLASRDVI